jgi:MFS family permease
MASAAPSPPAHGESSPGPGAESSPDPRAEPSRGPGAEPSRGPGAEPSRGPGAEPSPGPRAEPSPHPRAEPSPHPRAEPSPHPRAALRAARAATALTFFLTGAVFATWAARLPALTERLVLSPGGASIALAGVEAGALGGLAVSGRLVDALGSAKSLRVGFAAYPAALVAVALAPSLAWLVAAMAVLGVANSVIDVAMNVQGVELERRYGRPLLSGLHSAHSFGVVAGGVGGTLCAARGVPLTAHFAVVAAIAFAASQLSIGALVSERPEDADHDAPREGEVRPGAADDARRDGDVRPGAAHDARRDGDVRPGAADDARRARRRLVAIGLLASGAFFVEGAAGDWSAIELRAVHGAGPGLASAAFTTFSLALALGRLGADRLVARHGRARFTRAAASVAAIGAGAVVVSGSAGLALIGWAGVGAGVAGIAPTLLGAAPGASAAPPSVAIATVSAIGYGGSFAGPPLIGALASLVSLPAALGALVLGAIAIALCAGRTLSGGDRPAEGHHGGA